MSPRSLTSGVLCDGRSSRLNRTTSPNRLSQSGSRKFVALRHRLCQPNCSANYPFGHRVAQTDNRVYFSALKHDEEPTNQSYRSVPDARSSVSWTMSPAMSPAMSWAMSLTTHRFLITFAGASAYASRPRQPV